MASTVARMTRKTAVLVVGRASTTTEVRDGVMSLDPYEQCTLFAAFNSCQNHYLRQTNPYQRGGLRVSSRRGCRCVVMQLDLNSSIPYNAFGTLSTPYTRLQLTHRCNTLPMPSGWTMTNCTQEKLQYVKSTTR